MKPTRTKSSLSAFFEAIETAMPSIADEPGYFKHNPYAALRLAAWIKRYQALCDAHMEKHGSLTFTVFDLETTGLESAHKFEVGLAGVTDVAGLKIVDVPVDHDGMAPDPALWQAAPPRLLFVTPSHQYPLGSVLSLERRLDFLQRVQAAGGWLIEDDYDSDFNHAQPGARPLPAIQGLRPDAPVVYVGTFSKLLYPGLRIAYLVVPRWAVADIGEAIHNLYRGGQAVEQRALARFLDGGLLTRHARRMAPVYRERQAVLRAELRARFGDECAILGGHAGLHLVLRLPDGMPDTRLVEAALAQGVVVRALSDYYASQDTGTAGNGLVLGYGMAESSQIGGLVKRLAIGISNA